MGKHLLLDLFGVEALLLLDMEGFIEFIRPTLHDCLADVVGETHHKFPGQNSGYTSLFLLSSSHLSIHTWPEKNSAAVDIFTCGDVQTESISDYVIKFFCPKESNTRIIIR